MGRSLELLQEVPAHGQGVVEEEAAELAVAAAVAVGAWLLTVTENASPFTLATMTDGLP